MGEVIRKKPASSESWKDRDLRPSLYSWTPTVQRPPDMLPASAAMRLTDCVS